jgi:hypothetical protein
LLRIKNLGRYSFPQLVLFMRPLPPPLPDFFTATTTDYRGTRTEHGIDGFFRGLTEWSKHFQSNHHSRKEFLEDTSTRVSVRVLNRLGLVVPMNDQAVSEENEHKWTEEFEVAPDGLITKVHVSVILDERPRR